MRVVLLIVVFSLPAAAEQRPSFASQLFLMTGSATDLGTTVASHPAGLAESNPILGRTRAQQSAVMIGSTVLVHVMSKRLASNGHPKLASALNFAVGGLHFTAAASNVRLSRSLR